MGRAKRKGVVRLTLSRSASIVRAGDCFESSGSAALAFVYTAGWLSPQRLTPEQLIAALQSPGGPPLGRRRNHVRGICFTGTFEANGAGTQLSSAQVFTRGHYPVIGRFNIAGSDPNAPDPMAQVRGFSTLITTPDGQEWRSAMLDAPTFAAPTPQAFYQFLTAAANKDPSAMPAYIKDHPEILDFIGWVKTHARTESWSENRFNGLNSFIFTNAAGASNTVRWSFVPAAPIVELTPDELATRGPDFLFQDITQRIAAGPSRWTLLLTVANASDPTADPTKAWPADRRSIDVGTLVVDQIEPEANGPCRDINYDPTVLPSGISTSDDPFPAARSAAYAVSYDARAAEAADYPPPTTGDKP